MANNKEKKESKTKDSPKEHGGEFKKERSISFLEAFNRFFDEPWMLPENGWIPDLPHMMNSNFPRVDISETESEVEVVVDVPGIDPGKIKVDIKNGVLTISGEDKYEDERKNKKYHRYERRYGSFSRSITLPKSVNEEGGRAEIKEGVLKVVFPKSIEESGKNIKIEMKK